MHRPPTRGELQRALALNAATKPLNVIAPAGVLVAGLLVGTTWLVAVAVVTWLALLVATFFDEREAIAVGERVRAARRAPAPRLPTLVPALARRWDAALAARASIRRDGADAPLLMHEVDALVEALRPTVEHAQRIHDALLTGSGAARERLQARLRQLLDEIDQVVATLETVHAELLVADQDELLADLRARVALLAADEPAA
jgi:hypothetical protein